MLHRIREKHDFREMQVFVDSEDPRAIERIIGPEDTECKEERDRRLFFVVKMGMVNAVMARSWSEAMVLADDHGLPMRMKDWIYEGDKNEDETERFPEVCEDDSDSDSDSEEGVYYYLGRIYDWPWGEGKEEAQSREFRTPASIENQKQIGHAHGDSTAQDS